jgi:hypothetical protein
MFNSEAIRFVSNRKTVLLILILISVLIGNDVYNINNIIRTYQSQNVPLLLNSGYLRTNQANVSIVIWFENRKIPRYLPKILYKGNWEWNYKEKVTETGKTAITLFGQSQVNKNEERNLYIWYTMMVQLISKLGGQIYLDERIPENIDVFAYMSQMNACPEQAAIINNLASIAAYQKSIVSSVKAGRDTVNLQLVSRREKFSEGQTVLAIPALLEEF